MECPDQGRVERGGFQHPRPLRYAPSEELPLSPPTRERPGRERPCDSDTRTAGLRSPRGWLEFDWSHDPDRGETEIFVPNALFPAGTIVAVQASGVTWHRDPARQVLVCRAKSAMTIHLKVTAPAEAGHLAADPDRAPRVRRGAG